MTVYVDVLLCVNIFINFFILLCVKEFLKANASLLRLILTSAAASLLSIAVFLPKIPVIINIIFKTASGALIVFGCFGRAPYKLFLKRLCAFVLINLGFCGMMTLVYQFVNPNAMLIFNDVVYFNISPVLLIIMTVICYFILRFIQKITGREESASGYYTVKFTTAGKSFTCLGKVDTGCTLKEPFSGAPVIVAERRILGDDFSPDASKRRIIPFESMGGNGIIEGFVPDTLKLNNNLINQRVYIGLCNNNFNGEFQALINAEVLE